MKLPKNYFENLTINKYREYLKLLPAVQQENTRVVITLILTFVAMSFFGIFAINPTLSTIITLRKQLSDNQLVYERLKTKISNLSSLQQQYAQLGPDLPLVFEAIPQQAKAPTLFSQIIGLAKEENVKISALETSNILLSNSQVPKMPVAASQTPSGPAPIPPAQTTPASGLPVGDNVIKPDTNSYAFSLKAQGTYQELISFARSLTKISRIINVESLSLTKEEKQSFLVLNLSGRAYFLK